MKVAILTVSDRSAEGIYEDQSGPLLARIVQDQTGWKVSDSAIVADEIDAIKSRIVSWCDVGINLILTTGGTGFGPRDRTPEATRMVIEREAPGIAEALRAESSKFSPFAMLSRGKAGIRDQTLIINLPGNPKAVSESMEILLPVLPHALELIKGIDSPHSGI